jgi:hypothetical protein
VAQSQKDRILAADDLPVEEVRVEEWNETVRVRTMTNREQDDLLFQFNQQKAKGGAVDPRGLRVKMVQLTVVDDDGELLFSPGDILRLGQKSAKAIDAIFQVAQRLNGFSDEQVEELVGNSPETPSVASGTS